MIRCNKCSKECFEDDLRKLRGCDHIYCCKCLVDYLKNIKNPKVPCMIPKCKGFVSDKLIRECLSNTQILAYEQLSILNTSKGASKALQCLTERCPFFVVVNEESVVFECSYCKSPNCTKCNKRHYINDCGRKIANEDAIEARATQVIKEQKRLELEDLKAKFVLLPNTESFECSICEEFFLPRTEIILKNCLHSFCRPCLVGYMQATRFISQCVCPFEGCGKELDAGELFALDPEGHISKMKKEASCRFFQCKKEDCTGTWDVKVKKGSYKCPKCFKSNCLECEDIHNNMSCSEFRQTKRYISPENVQKAIDQNKHIKCFVCFRDLVQKGGCGAIFCDNCGGQTCIFTGKIAGRHDPDKCYCKGEPNCTKSAYFCDCSPKKPCDKQCKYGCFPENPK